jgi:hypothetical protein
VEGNGISGAYDFRPMKEKEARKFGKTFALLHSYGENLTLRVTRIRPWLGPGSIRPHKVHDVIVAKSNLQHILPALLQKNRRS